jgi:hypothetical protein
MAGRLRALQVTATIVALFETLSSYREHGETVERKPGWAAHRSPVGNLLPELTDLSVKSALSGFPSFCHRIVLSFSRSSTVSVDPKREP